MRNSHAIAAAVLAVVTATVFIVPGPGHSSDKVSQKAPPPPSTKMQNGIDREPPAPIYEVEPGERPGYTWSSGCWTLARGKLVWSPGKWIANRPGYAWVPAGWEQRADRWYYVEGYWQPTDAAEEEEEETVDETTDNSTPPAEAVSHAPHKKALVKKPVSKKPNYSNQQIWPSYQRN